MSLSNYKLILGSASPRRSDLLSDMGCCFETCSADIDESHCQGEAPVDYVERLAKSKAKAVYQALPTSGDEGAQSKFAVLAADTIVVKDNNLLGKPLSYEHATSMWQALSGATHSVLTAVCLHYLDDLGNTNSSVVCVSTNVSFAEISDEEMQRYWQSLEPQDKAGAYGIQGRASAWVQQLSGSYSNVVGLPLRETNQLLKLVGHNWL